MKKVILIFCITLLAGITFSAEKYAVIIGINDYMNDRVQDLRYSEADASYLADVLFRYSQYKPSNIRLLLGEDASYANIKKEVYWLGEISQPDDEVFFYFSGHGTRVEDKDGNEDDNMDEAFCPYETDLENKASVILDDEMGHWFGRIKADKVVVVLDCCHSGGAAGKSVDKQGTKGLDMKLPTTARGHINPDMNPYAMDLNVENKFVMTASDADQQSFENPELGHGVFTYYLGKAIQGESDHNGDNIITTREVFDYTKKNTEAFAKTIRRDQTPVHFGELNVPLSQKNNLYCELSWYDDQNQTVDLAINENDAEIGDIILIRRTGDQSRDLNVRDDRIMKVKLTQVAANYAEGEVIETYFENIQIKAEDYSLYYGEKVSVGNIAIFTEPWSTVYMDGEKVGTTPLAIQNIPEGNYELTFQIDIMGYPEKVNKTISVGPEQTVRVSEKFEKVQ